MELLSLFTGFGSTAASYIVPFLFVLTIVVFFHELGHFLVARWTGVAVTTFSIGFGPELLGFTDRKGTRWRLSLIPLGGYVRFLGDDNEASATDRAALAAMSQEDRRKAFAGKGVGARAAIVAAGPFANFILAILIFTVMFSTFGRQVMTPRVDSLVAGGVAEKAGFKPGDIILSIDGTPIDNFNDLQRIVSISSGTELSFAVKRGDQALTIKATPELKEMPDQFGNQNRMGVLGIGRNATPDQVQTERFSVPAAAAQAVKETWFVVDRTFTYLIRVLAGRESADQLGGPLRVAEVSAQVATIGILPLINLAAILSISIGLINLFPVPMLDGGHLLFYLIEAVRGRPLSDRAQDIGFRIGFVAMVALMIFATWNDIIHLSSL
jgi:regulator of sigma E protease